MEEGYLAKLIQGYKAMCQSLCAKVPGVPSPPREHSVGPWQVSDGNTGSGIIQVTIS